MNLNRRDLLVSLYTFTVILGAISPHQAAFALERTPPRIKGDISIPCTAEEAWAAWTTAEGLESFLARSARVSLVEGGEYVIDRRGGGPGDLLHTRSPRILRIDAPRELSFEWVIPLPEAAARDPMTIVTIRIEPVSPQRTRVRLEHTGWTSGEKKAEAFAYSQRAWKIVLRNLRSALSVRGQ